MPSLAALVLALYYGALGILALYGLHRVALLILMHRHRRAAGPAAAEELTHRVTVQLPLYNERFVASRLLAAVCRLDYPKHYLPFVAEGRRREIVGDRTGIDVRWKLRYYTDGIDVTWWPGADERDVRAGEPADVVTAMRAMRAWLAVPGEDIAPGQVSDDMDAALRGLGYTSPSRTTTPKKR